MPNDLPHGLPHGLPRQIQADDTCLLDILLLIQRSFAYMEPRIDPPSSMYRLRVEDIQRQCKTGEVWAIGTPPLACVFLKPAGQYLYVGKLAVAEEARGMGLARDLIALATDRAKSQGYIGLELETRIELVENHAAFQRIGFSITGEGAHEGYDRPTYIIMRRDA